MFPKYGKLPTLWERLYKDKNKFANKKITTYPDTSPEW